MEKVGFQPCEKIVEPILDHDIYASEILPSYTAPNRETLLDIRMYAHDLALDALVKVRGGAGDVTGDAPSTQEIAEARDIMQPYLPELRTKLTRAHYLHSAKKLLESEDAHDIATQLRADFQHEMVSDVWRHMQMVRLRPDQTVGSDVLSSLETGVVIVAPTGSGKTYIIAKALQLCGVGRVLGPDNVMQTALVSVPTLELIDQYSSNDERNIFRKVIGWDVPIAQYHGRSKEQSAVTLITHRSLQAATEDGIIKGDDYAYTAFDEVHHSMAPKTLPALRRLKGGMLGTTATPAYSPTKDVRRYFPHVDGGSARDFIELGILNPTRLFSFAANSRDHGANMTATLAADWISQGLRTLVYCEFGEDQIQARRIATHINAMLGEDAVKAVGSFRGNESDTDVDAFRNGALKGLTATNMLKEGFDDNVDAVIMLGCRTSLVDISQMVGRALRRGDKISRIAEVIPPNPHRLRLKSIWDVFGLKVIRQGELIGGEAGQVDGVSQFLRGTLDVGRRPAGEMRARKPRSNPFIPENLQEFLLPEQPVRTALLAPNTVKQSEPPPDGYILAEALAAEFNTTIAHAASALQSANIGVHKSWIQIGRERAYELWFAPEALHHFIENPPLKVAHSNAMCSSQLVELTGLSRQFFVNTAQKLKLTPQERLIIGSSKPAHFYEPEDVAKILDAVDGLVFADQSDVSIGELSQMTSEHFVHTYIADPSNGIAAVSKRRHPVHGIKGITDHVTAEDAAKITAAYKISSGQGRMSLTEIASNAGVSLATVSKYLTPQQRKQLRSRHGAGRGSAKTLPMETAALIVNELKCPDAPPSHLAPSSTLHKRFGGVPKTTYKRWLRQFDPDFEYVKLRGLDFTPLCVKWDAYRQLEKQFPIAPGSPPIDYARLPQEHGNPSEASVLYGRIILDFYGLELSAQDILLVTAQEALRLTSFVTKLHVKAGDIFVGDQDTEEQYISPGTLRNLFKATATPSMPPRGYIAAQDATTRLAKQFEERRAITEVIRRAIADEGVKKCFARPNAGGTGDVYLEAEKLKAMLASRGI